MQFSRPMCNFLWENPKYRACILVVLVGFFFVFFCSVEQHETLFYTKYFRMLSQAAALVVLFTLHLTVCDSLSVSAASLRSTQEEYQRKALGAFQRSGLRHNVPCCSF